MKNRLFSLVLSLALLFVFANVSTFAQNNPNKMGAQTEKKIDQKTVQTETMNIYLLKIPHTSKNCLSTLDKVSKDSPELLNKIDWGCMSGDHTGYMTVNSKNEDAALQMIPASMRSEAKVEKLDKFTVAEITSLHQKH
jgi:hypothetical protein